MQFAAGATVGPWTLVRFLGEGENAEVWACQRDGEPERAVKILGDRLEHIAGALIVKRERVLDTGFMTRYGPWQAMPGSLEARQAIRSLINEMSNDLPAALQAFKQIRQAEAR